MSERDYINGIPFVLGQRFYPLPRTQFRPLDIHIPLDALQDEFDFSFERTTLRTSAAYLDEKQRLAQEAEDRRQRAEAAKVAAEEAAAAEAEARAIDALIASQDAETGVTEDSNEGKAEENERDNSSTASASDPLDLTVTTQDQSHPPNPSSQSYTTVSNGIGNSTQHPHPHFVYQIPPYPLPQQPQLQVNMCHLVEAPILKPQLSKATSAPRLADSTSGQTKLNLSDFEAAAASPFDSVALTSLDDRSELEKVWANNMNLRAASGSLPTPQTSQAFIPDGESLSQMYTSFQASNVNGVSHASQTTSPTATPTVISSQYYAPHPHQQQHGSISAVQQPHSTATTSYGPLQWSGYYGNAATQATPTSGTGTGPSTTSDSFTRVQFPFLSSLTHNNNRILLRQQNRLAERQYHQQQHQLQQQYYPPHAQPIYSPSTTAAPASAPLITSHVHSMQQPLPHPSDIQTSSIPVPGTSSNPRPFLRHPVPNYWHPGMAAQRFHEKR